MYSDLGGIVREVLGTRARFFRKRDEGQRGGARTAILKEQNNSMFVDIPLARFPPAPDLADLVNEALGVDEIYTIDDQRLVDAGVAAEYF